jgi:4'-phosphopantetheinyl transferase
MTGVQAKLGPYLALDKRDVHLWHLDLDDWRIGERKCASLLSADESERAARFRFARDRRRFNICRAALRMLLASYLEEEPSRLTFSYAGNGKPELGGIHESSGLRFNVSHSGDMACVGVTSERRIGVDIEAIRYDVEIKAIAERFFSVSEQRDLAGLPAEDQHRGFFNCWARKEAYVKALGSGLSRPLSEFDVSLRPGEPAGLLATRPDPNEAKGWTMLEPELGEKYAAAIVAEGTGLELTCRELISSFCCGDADANS